MVEMIRFKKELEKQKLKEKTERLRRQIWLNLFLMVQRQLLKQVFEKQKIENEERAQIDDMSVETVLNDRMNRLKQMSQDLQYQERVDKGIMKTFFKDDLSTGFKKFLIKYNLEY